MLKKHFFRLLIISCLLNVCLISALTFLLLKQNAQKNPLPFTLSASPLHPTNFSTLQQYAKFSFEQLVQTLDDAEFVEEGYCQRDLALAMLVYKHDFAIERALQHQKLQRRKFSLGDKEEFILFAGLTADDYLQIKTFLQSERFPFSTQGLFTRLQKQTSPELVQALVLTKEFLAYETVFRRTLKGLIRKDLFALVMEGDWEAFYDGYLKLVENGDFSENSCQEILQNYLKKENRQAAKLLVQTDLNFSFQRLSDAEILFVLSCLDTTSIEAQSFAEKLLGSKRSDAVLKQASGFLGKEVVGPLLEPRPGIGQLRPKFRETSPAAPPPNVHIVQKGESLWTIAHRYHVSIDALVKMNHLQTTILQPGQILKLF